MDHKLSYLEYKALKDLYGFYCLWGFSQWRMKTFNTNLDIVSLQSLIDKGYAIKNTISISTIQKNANEGKLFSRFAMLLVRIAGSDGEQFQITSTGIDYCNAHNIFNWRDAIR